MNLETFRVPIHDLDQWGQCALEQFGVASADIFFEEPGKSLIQ